MLSCRRWMWFHTHMSSFDNDYSYLFISMKFECISYFWKELGPRWRAFKRLTTAILTSELERFEIDLS